MGRDTILRAAALLGMTLLLNFYFVYQVGDGLSPYADPYSEANSLRAGERFANEGFTINYGLSDLSYGGRYPGVGMGPSGKDAKDPIYHGYPPGPDWLNGIYIRMFGPERLARFRMFPVALGLLAAAWFLAGLTRAIGPLRAAAVYLACLLTPMFTAMTHGLHYQGYATSLLLIELGILLDVLSRPGRMGRWPVAALFLLGFLQGWLSFDYCFLVTFAPLPIFLLVAPAGSPIRWRALLALCGAAGLGFTAAHLLHFAQSVLYFGGLRPTLEEYAYRSAKQYAVGSLELLPRYQCYGIGMWRYLRAFLRWNHLFSVPGELVLLALASVLLVRHAAIGTGSWRLVVRVTRPGPRALCGVALALLVGLGWLFAKPYHAINHLPFIGRHLLLFYVACCMVVARATVIEAISPHPDRGRRFVRARGRGAASGSAPDARANDPAIDGFSETSAGISPASTGSTSCSAPVRAVG